MRLALVLAAALLAVGCTATPARNGASPGTTVEPALTAAPVALAEPLVPVSTDYHFTSRDAVGDLAVLVVFSTRYFYSEERDSMLFVAKARTCAIRPTLASSAGWLVVSDEGAEFPASTEWVDSDPVPRFPAPDKSLAAGECAHGWLTFRIGNSRISRVGYRMDDGTMVAWRVPS